MTTRDVPAPLAPVARWPSCSATSTTSITPNDTDCHATGDALLAETAQPLHDRRRGQDIAARHGGDEFLALLSDLPADGHTADQLIHHADTAMCRVKTARRRRPNRTCPT